MRTNCDDCGKCCEYMLIPLKDADIAKWVLYHGVEAEMFGTTWYAKIKKVCNMLTEDKRCKVHGTPDMPDLCRRFVCRALDPRGVPVDGVDVD